MKTIILSSYDDMYRGSLFVINPDHTITTPKIEIEELRELNGNKKLGYFCFVLDKLKELLIKKDIPLEIGDRVILISDGMKDIELILKDNSTPAKWLLDIVEEER